MASECCIYAVKLNRNEKEAKTLLVTQIWWSLKFKVFKTVSLFKSENTMTPCGVCSRDIIFCSVFLFHFVQNLTFSVRQSNFPLDRTLGCVQNYFELKETLLPHELQMDENRIACISQCHFLFTGILGQNIFPSCSSVVLYYCLYKLTCGVRLKFLLVWLAKLLMLCHGQLVTEAVHRLPLGNVGFLLSVALLSCSSAAFFK